MNIMVQGPLWSVTNDVKLLASYRRTTSMQIQQHDIELPEIARVKVM